MLPMRRTGVPGQRLSGAGSPLSDLCRSRVDCVESHEVAGVRVASIEEADEGWRVGDEEKASTQTVLMETGGVGRVTVSGRPGGGNGGLPFTGISLLQANLNRSRRAQFLMF
jgi:hypothetical protein